MPRKSLQPIKPQEPIVTKSEELEKALVQISEEHSKRHWKELCAELGARQVPLSALGDVHAYGTDLVALLDPENDYITLSELAILAQYKQAISAGDTRAATFLRDTAGFKPATDVTVEQKNHGLSSLSDDELKHLIDLLEEKQDC